MQIEPIDFLVKLSDALRKDNRLEKLSNHFTVNHYFAPVFGIEIEFYLSQNISATLMIQELGLPLKPEKGNNQFEIDLPPSGNLTDYANKIIELKLNLIEAAQKSGGSVDFKSKPFPNDYGSSMHYNLSFTNAPETLEHAAKSLCHFMVDSFLIFMPDESDYLRSDARFMAPTHISYGGNNRTTAIRIPDSLPLRLEHRIAAVSSDPYLVMTTILTSVLKGLKNPGIVADFPKIYGNAYDKQYNLTPLPATIDEAKNLFKPEFFNYPF